MNHPLSQLDPDVPDAAEPRGKRDRLRALFGKPKSKGEALSQPPTSQSPSEQTSRPPSIVSPTTNAVDTMSFNIQSVSASALKYDKPLPAPPAEDECITHIFPENLPKPQVRSTLPDPQDRIDRTDQLIYACSLLLHGSTSPLSTVNSLDALQELTLDQTELEWLKGMKENPEYQDHMRDLVTKMVEEFVMSALKTSDEITEIVALGPILGKEHYRKPLSCCINSFDNVQVLDDDLLRGLVQLVQVASPGFLDADDLIKILSIIRIRLQDTHQHSIEHSYHLILAVSSILDVMIEHKVKDLDRVQQHEPLSEVLSGLQGSSDPYLMYCCEIRGSNPVCQTIVASAVGKILVAAEFQ